MRDKHPASDLIGWCQFTPVAADLPIQAEVLLLSEDFPFDQERTHLRRRRERKGTGRYPRGRRGCRLPLPFERRRQSSARDRHDGSGRQEFRSCRPLPGRKLGNGRRRPGSLLRKPRGNDVLNPGGIVLLPNAQAGPRELQEGLFSVMTLSVDFHAGVRKTSLPRRKPLMGGWLAGGCVWCVLCRMRALPPNGIWRFRLPVQDQLLLLGDPEAVFHPFVLDTDLRAAIGKQFARRNPRTATGAVAHAQVQRRPLVRTGIVPGCRSINHRPHHLRSNASVLRSHCHLLKEQKISRRIRHSSR